MIKISCPFCGYSKNVSVEKLPARIRGVICPICGKKFNFTAEFYTKAGFFVRLLALIIDLLILKIIAIIIGALLDYTLTYLLDKFVYWEKEKINTLIGGVIYSVWTIIPFFYFTISTWQYGKSIGKLFLGIRIVNNLGEKPDLKISIKREIVGKLLSGLILGIGFFMVLFDKNKQALHDKLAGTYVVYNL
ncbi:MAG: RDD family protein [Proteobacteria bacterium]|nr:RDD family protein [Pseudomonadota bacterium]